MLVVAVAVLLPLLAVAGYTATTKWLLAGPPTECELVSQQNLEQILQVNAVEINRRTIRSVKGGGWEYSCSYLGQGDAEDSGYFYVNVLTGPAARAQKLRDPRIMENATQLTGFGDDAWIGEDGPLPRDAYERMLRHASDRLSTVPEFPQAELTGVCEQLDLALGPRRVLTAR